MTPQSTTYTTADDVPDVMQVRPVPATFPQTWQAVVDAVYAYLYTSEEAIATDMAIWQRSQQSGRSAEHATTLTQRQFDQHAIGVWEAVKQAQRYAYHPDLLFRALQTVSVGMLYVAPNGELRRVGFGLGNIDEQYRDLLRRVIDEYTFLCLAREALAAIYAQIEYAKTSSRAVPTSARKQQH